MRTIVKGKNYDVPDRVREYAERKLTRLERFLDLRRDPTAIGRRLDRSYHPGYRRGY